MRWSALFLCLFASQFCCAEQADEQRREAEYYVAASCARQGRDKTGDNLAICIADPRKYKCWAGCGKEEIRAALGYPIRYGTRVSR